LFFSNLPPGKFIDLAYFFHNHIIDRKNFTCTNQVNQINNRSTISNRLIIKSSLKPTEGINPDPEVELTAMTGFANDEIIRLK
jgi:hypothetical protein